MAAHAHQRAAAGQRPLRGVRGMRAAVALVALHEQDFVLGGAQDFHGLRNRRRVDPVLRVHEQAPARRDRRRGALHLLHHALIHQRLRHIAADRRLVVGTAEVTGERLLADDVLSRLHGLDDHLGVCRRRRADVDDVDVFVGEQRAVIAMGRGDAMLLGELDDVVAARAGRRHLRVDAVHPRIGIHVQFGDEAAPDQTHPHLRHRRAPVLVCGRRCSHGRGRQESPPLATKRTSP
jgi:hypothetical protein